MRSYLSLCALLLLACLRPAHAATFTVNTTDDDDGTCTAASCSVREAVKAANAAAGDDSIVIDPGSNTNYPIYALHGQPLAITSGGITFTGFMRIVLDGGDGGSEPGSGRVFKVGAGGRLTVNGTNSNSPVIRAGYGADGDGGGAIYNNQGSVTLNNVMFRKNVSTTMGGAVRCIGGQLTINRCRFTDGSAGTRGGVLDLNGTTAQINSSIFDHNTAPDSGGALRLSGGTVNLASVTISFNSVTGGSGTGGGAIESVGSALALTGCTIADNAATHPTAAGLGGIVLNGGTLSVDNSIVADNGLQDFVVTSGTLSNGGFNLIGSNDGVEATFPTGPLTGTADAPVEPRLSEIQQASNWLCSRALLGGSPALDAGKSTFNRDGRDEVRPVDLPTIPNAAGGNGGDIGAYEAKQVAQSGPVFHVNARHDESPSGECGVTDCTLTDAVDAANASSRIAGGGAYSIVFDGDAVSQTPALISSNMLGLVINCDLTITAPSTGMTLTGYYKPLFEVQSGHLTLLDLNVNGCHIEGRGAIWNYGGASLTVKRCSFTHNYGYNSGAIYNDGSLDMENCSFSKNTGYYNGGGFTSSGTVDMRNCTFSGNADYDGNGAGGGICNISSGPVNADNCIFSGNVSPGKSPDVYGGIDGDNNLLQHPDTYTQLTGNGNITGKDAKVGPLALNGGIVATMPLLPGSPCINAAGSNFPATDARGVARPQGAKADIGAYELVTGTTDSVVVTTSADEDNGSADPSLGSGTSLREALDFADSNPGATDITFNLAAGNRSLVVHSALPVVNSDITVTGPTTGSSSGGGITIYNAAAAVGNCGLFNFQGGTSSLINLTLNGTPPGAAQGVDASVVANFGAALTLDSCTVTGCAESDGAVRSEAVYSASTTTTLRNCTLTGNTGGRVVSSNQANIVLDSCTITGNSSSGSPYAAIDVALGAYSFFGDPGLVTIGNSIVAGNSEAAPADTPRDVKISGSGPSSYYLTGPNLFGTGNAPTGTPAGNTNLTAADLKLGALSDNGGPTFTLPVLEGSPALNAGNTKLTVDQRGTKRPYGKADDIGAFEAQASTVLTINSFDLKPREPYTNEIMTANVKLAATGLKPTFTFVWKKNGQVMRTKTQSGSQDAYNLNATGAGDKGDVIECTVTVTNGVSTTTANGSATIRNSIPVISSLTLAPQAPSPTGSVSATYGGRDADGDTLQRTYLWRVGSKILKDEHGAKVDLSKYSFVKANDVVSVDLQLFDGEAASKTLTAKVTVAGAAASPSASSS